MKTLSTTESSKTDASNITSPHYVFIGTTGPHHVLAKTLGDLITSLSRHLYEVVAIVVINTSAFAVFVFYYSIELRKGVLVLVGVLLKVEDHCNDWTK